MDLMFWLLKYDHTRYSSWIFWKKLKFDYDFQNLFFVSWKIPKLWHFIFTFKMWILLLKKPVILLYLVKMNKLRFLH